ncbi:MAG: PAS domain S-box protein [Chthoniobacterales bacterium]
MSEADDQRLRSAALQNAQAILLARNRAEAELLAAKEALESKTRELAHSLAVMRATLDSTTDGIVVVDETGAVTGFNDQFVTMWGIPREALAAGGRMAFATHAATLLKDPQQFATTTDGIYAKSPRESFDVLKLNDGRVFERFSKVQSVEGRNVGRVWSYRDVTERKAAEQAARTSNARFEAIIEHSPVGTYVLDAQLQIQHVNAKARPVFGEGSPVGRDLAETLRDLWPEALVQELVPRFRHTLETGEPFFQKGFSETREDHGAEEYYDWEIHRITLPDGQHGVACYFTDIKEHVLAQEALRRSEEDLQALANSIPQLAWMAGPDGSIFWYNRGWFDYTGTTLEAMQGWGWQSVHDPEILPSVVERWTASIRTCKPFEMEFPLRGADGIFRWFLTRVNPVLDAEGRIVRWFGTNTDVDRVKHAEADRERLLASEKEARERAERETRMKDEFLATLSHELRTPLNAILGWATILAGSRQADEVTEAAEVIERNARAQAQIIEDLLDMSRIISGKVRLDVQRVELIPIIESALESVKPMADGREIRLTSVLDPHVGQISADPGRLQQVLWNLLTNALKFTPKGGRVHVALGRVNSHLEISVSDNGQGMETDFLPHAFDRFRQADATTTRQHRGLGLGLSIVKTLIELHGGTVSAESPGPGQGSTFYLCLPAAVATIRPEPERRHPRAPAPREVPDEHLDLTGLRILAVDDEPDARELINRILSSRGATVETAASGADALKALSENKPDVLIMDIGMPDEDGYSVIRKVRQLAPELGGNVRAVALTAFARAEDRRRALISGFQMHMAKPVEPSELIAVIASLANRRG